MIHAPVLTKEVIDVLDPKSNENFIDCTIGQGGHTKLILGKTVPNGKVLGIDLDKNQIENCKSIFSERLILENDSYANLEEIVKKNNFGPVNGILIDLGMSSWQLEDSKKGFSFLKDEPLDMRYGQAGNLTAREIVNEWSEEEIKKIVEEYGEERFAKQIAEEIVKERADKKIESTFDLVQVIKKAVLRKYRFQNIHCATRTFQALRIAVNDELGNLKKVLPQAISVLSSGGRLAIISFHSLEDRIVKDFLKENVAVKVLTKKPITAAEDEIRSNPRSRSAKLRAIIKI